MTEKLFCILNLEYDLYNYSPDQAHRLNIHRNRLNTHLAKECKFLPCKKYKQGIYRRGFGLAHRILSDDLIIKVETIRGGKGKDKG